MMIASPSVVFANAVLLDAESTPRSMTDSDPVELLLGELCPVLLLELDFCAAVDEDAATEFEPVELERRGAAEEVEEGSGSEEAVELCAAEEVEEEDGELD